MKNREQSGGYISPQVETIGLGVERGYAASGEVGSDTNLMNLFEGGDV